MLSDIFYLILSQIKNVLDDKLLDDETRGISFTFSIPSILDRKKQLFGVILPNINFYFQIVIVSSSNTFLLKWNDEYSTPWWRLTSLFTVVVVVEFMISFFFFKHSLQYALQYLCIIYLLCLKIGNKHQMNLWRHRTLLDSVLYFLSFCMSQYGWLITSMWRV